MLSYSDKLILAPMVRVGTLPMRLLAVDYGADIVYSEEIIDFRLLKCKRVENRILGTTDFIDEDQNVVFRTCEKERSHVVLQLGTCSAERALKAAKMVESDVAAIDINMGCPKEFSLKGGMGAALLTQPEKIKEILETLTKNLSCPVTCKIRVLPQVEDTVILARLIESTGVSALAVHGRTKEERPQHKNRNYVIRAISEALSIPVIANGGSGEISCHEDIEIFRNDTRASSVMLARQAEKNCSIFRKDGLLPLDDVIIEYLKYAIEYGSYFANTKYCIQQMLGSLQESERGKILLNAQQIEVICDLWNLKGYLEVKQLERNFRAEKLSKLQERDFELQSALKRRRLEQDDVCEMDIKFMRNLFSMDNLPKTVLWNWTLKKKYKLPHYQTDQVEKSFQSVVTVNNKKYSNRCLEKNKKNAEQAAALVAITALGLLRCSVCDPPCVGDCKELNCVPCNNENKVSVDQCHNSQLHTEVRTPKISIQSGNCNQIYS